MRPPLVGHAAADKERRPPASTLGDGFGIVRRPSRLAKFQTPPFIRTGSLAGIVASATARATLQCRSGLLSDALAPVRKKEADGREPMPKYRGMPSRAFALKDRRWHDGRARCRWAPMPQLRDPLRNCTKAERARSENPARGAIVRRINACPNSELKIRLRAERWPSGRRRSPAKGVYAKSVSRVRIPSSPPLAPTKAFSRSGCGRIFPLFSRVVRVGLSTDL